MKLNKYIDHTLLKPDAHQEQIEKLIEEAREYDFASVCVNPTWVSFAAEGLRDTDVKVCTVIGFPLGANTPAVKAFEAKDAIKNGADEVDMVINTPTKGNDSTRDGFKMRRTAIEFQTEIMTSLDTLKAMVAVNRRHVDSQDKRVYSLREINK